MRLAFRKIAYEIFCHKGWKKRYKNDNVNYYLENLEQAIILAREMNVIRGHEIINFIKEVKEKNFHIIPSSKTYNDTSYYSDIYPL